MRTIIVIISCAFLTSFKCLWHWIFVLQRMFKHLYTVNKIWSSCCAAILFFLYPFQIVIYSSFASHAKGWMFESTATNLLRLNRWWHFHYETSAKGVNIQGPLDETIKIGASFPSWCKNVRTSLFNDQEHWLRATD